MDLKKTVFLSLMVLTSVTQGCTDFFGKEDVSDPTDTIYKDSRIVGAPPLFPHPHLPGNIAPIDIRRSTVELKVDVAAETVRGRAKIWFEMQEGGYPYFDFSGTVESLKLNGKTIELQKLKTIADPDEVAQLRLINELLKPQITYTLQIDFETPTNQWVQVNEQETDVFFFYNDFNAGKGRGFLGRYIPSNLEFDQYDLDLRVEVVGAASGDEQGEPGDFRIYTNGKLKMMNASSWRITFPSYFNSSAAYLHLTNKPYAQRIKNIMRKSGRLPVTVYSESEAEAEAGLKTVEKLLKKHEAQLGPFPHERLVVRLHDKPWGVEYAGATLTHRDALEHELLHSWFGRYVFPASGNAAWLDEAIVIWISHGYPRTQSPRLPAQLMLASRAPYQRMTPKPAYLHGEAVLQKLDQMAGEGGLKPLLAEFLNLAGGLVITSADFQKFLLMRLGEDVNDVFCQYVYGQEGACERAIEIPGS